MQMGNVRFRYLYRDASNFKKWGEVVFSSCDGLPLDTVAESIERHFSPDALFTASQVNVPEVFLFDDYRLNPDDHCFHEFDSVEVTEDSPNDRLGRSISEFVQEVEKESRRGWEVFDPLEPFAWETRMAFKRMFLS